MTKVLRSGTLPGWANPVGRGVPQRRAQLVDVRELRIAPATCEIRALSSGDLVATGYASTFQEYEVYGGPENYGWIEKIDRNAFTKTMASKPDVVYLVNHDGLPLARTKSGTLKLGVDDGGLAVEALLEKSDPDVQALQPKMARGDVDEMSFAFYVKANEWSAAPGWDDDPYSYRKITELSIHRGDVSVVTFGANPTTTAKLGLVGTDGMLGAPDLGDKRAGTIIDLGGGKRAVLLGDDGDQRGAGAPPAPPAGVAGGKSTTVSVADLRAGGTVPEEDPDTETPEGDKDGALDDEVDDDDTTADDDQADQDDEDDTGDQDERMQLGAAREQLGLRSDIGMLRKDAGLPDTASISLADARAAAPKA